MNNEERHSRYILEKYIIGKGFKYDMRNHEVLNKLINNIVGSVKISSVRNVAKTCPDCNSNNWHHKMFEPNYCSHCGYDFNNKITLKFEQSKSGMSNYANKLLECGVLFDSDKQEINIELEKLKREQSSTWEFICKLMTQFEEAKLIDITKYGAVMHIKVKGVKK